jgi:two-component system phosphate regulon sensor histidine kinase PhoR
MALINDLLDMAKLDSGQLQFSMQRLNINDVLQEVLQNFELRAQEKGLIIETDFQDDLYVKGDFERLVQVFSNLVSNAIKYTEHGHVLIKNVSSKGSVHVHVKDSGVGVSQEDVHQLFEKFFRSSNSYTQTISGTGLGLAISKTIVEHHLGNIEVDSQLGEGSTFTVSLPKAG